MKIKDIIGREILDSRGEPTVEADVILENNIVGTASVASGASKGSREAFELRDNDYRYKGKGVSKAVENVNTIIRSNLIGMDIYNQELIDYTMIKLDGTDNKSRLGANAILAVSMAALKAASMSLNKPLYRYLNDDYKMPELMLNIINGGLHSSNNLSIQEFMIIPKRKSIKEKLRISSEVFHTLKDILNEKNYSTNVGDEGGFAPNLNSNIEALELIIEAINKSGYKVNEDFSLAIDVAASNLYKDGYYYIDNKKLDIDSLIEYYKYLIDNYNISSIEDPVYENDFKGFKKVTEALIKNVDLVGDDLFVTNKEYLKKGILNSAGNAIIIKPNQIGTITEVSDVINYAKENGYKTIMSHRSGETEDTIISDLAIGFSVTKMKSGSISRTDRVCKYNRLMKIEEEILNNMKNQKV